MRILIAFTAWSLTAFPVVCATAAEAPAPAESPTPEGTQALRTVPDTLMFTIDELNEIQSRIGAGGQSGDGGGRFEAIENATLFLSTILYTSPKDWTVWINGAAITPELEFGAFEVTQIGPDFVELLVPLSAQGMRPVRLAPNQTFIAKSGIVVEGQWKK